ncbi:MAG: YesL family protein [Clostridia bacterium]|nr:YesL family protein [Clostridia bacterium]
MGFFDRLYYGKAGKRDYSEMDMPKNRVSLFFLVLKDHLFDLIKVNLLQLVFWIPFIIWTYLNLMAIQSLDIAAVMGTENGAAVLLSEIASFVVMWLIGLVPCIAITGPSSAGAAYIMRNWARDQHAFLFSDFKDAFKGNWKQALGVSVLTSFAPLLTYTAVAYYGQLANSNLAMMLPLVLVVAVMMVWTLMLPLLYPMMIGYELTFRNLIKNALLMAVACLPKMVLSRIITFIPLAILFVFGVYYGYGIVIVIMVLYYLLFGFAFSKLVYASFANGVFDKYLNPHIEGAQVGMGLRPDDAELYDDLDDDEDEEDEEQEDENDEE